MSLDDSSLPNEEPDEQPTNEELHRLTAEASVLEAEARANDPYKDASAITKYLIPFRHYPPLEHEAFAAAHKAWKDSGDRQQRNMLVYSNIRLALVVARRYQGRGVDLLDLVQEGTLGLMRAVEKYDPSISKFSTYACWWLKRSYLNAIRRYNTTEPFTLPQHEFAFRTKVRKVIAILRKSGRNDLSNEEIFELLFSPEKKEQFDEAKIARLLVKIARTRRRLQQDSVVYLDAPLKANEKSTKSSTWQDTLPYEHMSAEQLTALSRIIEMPNGYLQTVHELLNSRISRDREIIYARFTQGAKLQAIGSRYELTRERIRQIEDKFVKRLALRLQLPYSSTMEMLAALGELGLLDFAKPPPKP